MTIIQASEKSNKMFVFDNLREDRVKQKPKYKLGQLVGTSDIRSVCSKKDSTKNSFEIYTITEVFHNTISSY